MNQHTLGRKLLWVYRVCSAGCKPVRSGCKRLLGCCNALLTRSLRRSAAQSWRCFLPGKVCGSLGCCPASSCCWAHVETNGLAPPASGTALARRLPSCSPPLLPPLPPWHVARYAGMLCACYRSTAAARSGLGHWHAPVRPSSMPRLVSSSSRSIMASPVHLSHLHHPVTLRPPASKTGHMAYKRRHHSRAMHPAGRLAGAARGTACEQSAQRKAAMHPM